MERATVKRPSSGGGLAYGKREMLAFGLYWSGIAYLLDRLRGCNRLVVLNYHRIGNAEDEPFAPNVYSATAAELDQQLAYLKSRMWLTTVPEALEYIHGRAAGRKPRCRVLITFDDGYLDNYQVAFPILRSHGVPAAFFLTTGLVGSCHIPWWDRIAFTLKTARNRRFTLGYPFPLEVDIDRNGVAHSLNDVVTLYKHPANQDQDRFLGEVEEAARPEKPAATQAVRRYLDWEEAGEMLAHGMWIGSHTHSHPVLSQLTAAQQRQELTLSRTLLKERLGTDPQVLAYPVGLPSSFTPDTQEIAREAGYRAAFSFYGGTNPAQGTEPFNIRRIGIGGSSLLQFRVRASICRVSGRYWP